MSVLLYLQEHYTDVLALLWEHIELTGVAVLLAVLIGVPLGILITYRRSWQAPVLNGANLMQAIPSLALLGFAIPFFGIGKVPAVLVVIVYSLLPIVKNTYTGLAQIDPNTREAARGIGLSRWQILRKVELPLALPVIMAGVRISAVTAVGLMTIAAFIGAGGLGDLVFAGIRTVDTVKILAGAIPACLLALAVDYLLGLVETLTTPLAAQLNAKQDRSRVTGKRRRAKRILSGALILALLAGGTSAYRQWQTEDADIVVGSKDFTENIVAAHLMSDIIEARTGLTVDRRINLGGTQVAYEALKSGQIDLYLDYTGTVYINLLNNEPTRDLEAMYNITRDQLKQRYDIDILTPYRFNNTYSIGVMPDYAAAHNLETISDLKRVQGHIRGATTFEFQNRPDGISGMLAYYGLNIDDIVGIDGSPRYTALASGDVQFIDTFATDGLIRKFDVKLLADDRDYFPPYYAVPMLRGETAQTHPEVVRALAELEPYLTDEVMQELNYRVDEGKEPPAKVARDYLRSCGLIK